MTTGRKILELNLFKEGSKSWFAINKPTGLNRFNYNKSIKIHNFQLVNPKQIAKIVKMNKLALSLTVFTIGLIIVVLPDTGERLFSLSNEHGPSLQDAIGLILIILSYLLLLTILWKQKEKILKYQNTILFRAGLFLFGLGYGLIVASVINDFKYWWIAGIVLLVILHVAVFYLALKKGNK